MAQDPAFLFYTGDFATGTQFFTNEQVGKYIRLLMAQHQHGHLLEKQVLLICGNWDDEIMKKFLQDEEQKYYNFRLETEINRRKAFTESRRNNRLDKGKNYKKQVKKTTKTYVKRMENENENKDSNKIIEKDIEIFENFRKKYGGTKKGSETEFKTLQKHQDWKLILPLLLPSVENQILERKQKKEKGLFVPEWKNLQTWLNQRCWEQETFVEEKEESKKIDYSSVHTPPKPII